MTPQQESTRSSPLPYLIWGSIYLVTIGSVTWGFWSARNRSIQDLVTSQAQTEWDAWRDEAAQQAGGSGPVTRRIPKSEQPPTLVLLRDHFWVCLFGALLLTSALFFTFVGMIQGSLSRPAFEPDLATGPSNAPPQNTGNTNRGTGSVDRNPGG